MVTRVAPKLRHWFRGEAMKRGVSTAALMRVALTWYKAQNEAGSLYGNDKATTRAVQAGAVPARLRAALELDQ